MSGFNNMRTRVSTYGQTTDERLSDYKLRSMKAAALNSYQAEDIEFQGKTCRCLINPSKLTEDYDQKIISIDYKYRMGPGDVFYWTRTDTYWLGLLRQWCEEAYLRMEIRKCNVEVEINDKSYHAYVKGPSSNSINWNEEHDIAFNDLDYDLLLYITKDDNTLNYFQRFEQLKIDGNMYKVATCDRYTMDKILMVYLNEDFNNDVAEEGEQASLDKFVAEQAKKEEEKKQEAKEAAKVSDKIILPREITIIGPDEVNAYDTNIVYKVDKNQLLLEKLPYRWKVASNKVKIVSQSECELVIDILYKKFATFNIVLVENGKELAQKQVIVHPV